MNRLPAFLFLVLLIVFAFSQQSPAKDRSYLAEYLAIDRIYQQAGQLSADPDYSDETAGKEEAMNRQALKGFQQLLPVIIKAKDDSLAFHSYVKTGVLLHYFDSLPAAKENYSNALALKAGLPSLADSFLFRPLLFIGGIQYNFNQFDSALINFKKAEEIAGRYPVALNGINRLYNTLGAIYFETGNYRQAKNYFGKAMALLGIPAPHSTEEALLINYRINLAATLTRLEEFDAANSIYQELLKQDINKNDILHNVGTINLRLGAARKALEFFRQVSYTNNRNVRLLNDIGQAFENMNQQDSARHYYLQAIAENKKWNNDQKNIQAGLSLKYLGDLDLAANDPATALMEYQQAISHLVPGFNEPDQYKNPSRYSGVFSYINLFNTLVAKASAFEKLYGKNKTIRELEASLATYKTAFSLAGYVEKTYDSDEARLFLNRIKYTVHSKPINLGLQLYELTKQKNFLEDAYQFDQRNKASILSLNVQESRLRNKVEGSGQLFEREASLRSSVTRLSLKAAQLTDSTQLADIRSSIRDHEIALGKIQEEIKKDPAYSEKHLAELIPPVAAIREKLDHSTTLVSYHLSEDECLALIISRNRFEYVRTPINAGFFAAIDSFKRSLHDLSPERRYAGHGVSSRLYDLLVRPLQPALSKTKRLIIIPDDELHYLPFEALEDEHKKYLVEQLAVQYLYSTALFQVPAAKGRQGSLLAFAPFTSRGYSDTAGTAFTALPASGEEVSGLEGRIFIGGQAAKKNFLKTANRYSIIHLATHASANNENPQRSFIAFYPAANDTAYKLYAQEIYNMQLDSTRLIILSACETGSGRLIRGEGLMSLSRAFAYAGCPDIITSLWKAEDKTTAFLTKRLHFYLDKGLSNDLALQKAKLDLLSGSETDARFKTPNYWAHLVFIGQYEPASTSSAGWWIIGAILIAFAFAILIRRRYMAGQRRSVTGYQIMNQQ